MSAAHLRVDGATVLRGTRRVLEDVSLAVSPGERIGLIGANGSGKSTLLSLISGSLDAQAASGSITVPTTLGSLAQELEHTADDSLSEVIESAVAPLRAIGTRLEEAAAHLADAASPHNSAAEDYEQALLEAEHSGLWELDAQIDSMLTGLGLGGIARSRPVAALSGGQRRRLALAALLLKRPSALVLDEPTNHLDDGAVAFLEQQLLGWTGPVLFASHDRSFLDAVATGIVDLDYSFGPEGPTSGLQQARRYTGGFSDYLVARAADRVRWQRAFEEQQAERRRLEYVIAVDARDVFHTTKPRSETRMAAKFEADRAAKTVGARLRQARNRLAELDRSPVHAPPKLLQFSGFERSGEVSAEQASAMLTRNDPIAVVHGAAVGRRLAPISLEIGPHSRLLIEGANGAGKSTLLSLLSGQLQPEVGTVELHGSVGLLAQYDSWPDLTVTAEQAYRQDLASGDTLPTPWELGLLDEAASRLPLAALSYGQRRRIALARLIADPPDLLLLDEPTNHLALSLAEELEQAIPDYPGAVVIASHDRWLRERWRGEVLQLHPAAS
ncbi:ABC-F family ATP-binding cassette domain-containing protein [Gulosibacter chungangensis]|uniref:ABC-F family ATP-binding cassette domain-containing protein n=1 Tax=Gulosibacter chungangensis TaxID=979746 RepID=A0A7J5B8W8_9MICO|nr:ATP-binding cassette domain-containing protein [Gulosibacter chungangensis]KAB1641871.1 ABC-F family ATP-binding cassette domain-containing protein [Gulosibacter chungangensis]